MRSTRRKSLIRTAEKVAAALALADVAFYFALVWPLGHRAAEEMQSLDSTRSHIHEMQTRVAQLERVQAALPGATEQLSGFLRKHVPPRRKGYSRALRLVQRLTEQSGVQLSSVAYKPNSTEGEPFERLGIELTVGGQFASILKFVHALETASDFILVRGFTFDQAEAGALQMRLNTELYLTP